MTIGCRITKSAVRTRCAWDHHLRELTRAFEQDGQKWAQDLSNLLVTINNKVIDAGGVLDASNAQKYRSKYRQIIKKGEIECPEPVRPKKKDKRGRIKKSKSRNLLERLRDYENDTLRFRPFDSALIGGHSPPYNQEFLFR